MPAEVNGLGLRVVSWNIHRCFGTDRRYWPERVAEVLAKMNADIIALQEVDSSLSVEGERDQLTYLSEALAMKAVMGPTLHRDYGSYGNALLTNFEILGSEEYDLSYRKFEPRGALAVELKAGSFPLRVVNTHLGLKYWERAFQIDRLLGELVWPESPPSRPVVLLGDFNEWCPGTPNGARLTRAFDLKTPRVSTFPSNWPRFALDRIFISGKVRDFKFEVCSEPTARVASDHLPLIAEFEL